VLVVVVLTAAVLATMARGPVTVTAAVASMNCCGSD
jgi:hypothetical protein